MAQLPYQIIGDIASFLSYNERMNVNMMIPIEYRYIKKLENVDGHNLYTKIDIVQNKLIKINKTPFGSKKRIIYFMRLFEYLLKTKDTSLFTVSPSLTAVLKQRTIDFSQIEKYGEIATKHTGLVLRCIRICQKLLDKIEILSTLPCRDIHVSTIKVI